jgi:hypothetical protein
MKAGTVEYFVRTLRNYDGDGQNRKEVYDSELWIKVRGHDNDGTFDPENIDSELVRKLLEENMRLLQGNPNLRKRESKAVEELPNNENSGEVSQTA